MEGHHTMTLNTTTHRRCIAAHIGNLDIFVSANRVAILEDRRDGEQWSFGVPNYGTDIAELMARPTARVALVHFPDFRVVYLYDAGDECFGYACNFDWPDGSEWGYAPIV
jgi:hypothetical protein